MPSTRITKRCSNPQHPFKTKTYQYDPGFEGSSEDFCSSCASYFRSIVVIIEAMLQPRPTLYGDKMIRLNREQAHEMIDAIFDDSLRGADIDD